MRRSRVASMIMLTLVAASSTLACADDSERVLAKQLPEEPLAPPFSARTFTWGHPSADGQRARAVVRQPDGKLVVAATADASLGGGEVLAGADYVDVIRLEHDGTVDTTFGTDGSGHSVIETFSLLASLSLAIAPDGNLYLVEVAAAEDEQAGAALIARLDANGKVDPSWGDSGALRIASTGSMPCEVAVQNDDKVVSMCALSNEVRRFEPNGKPDTTFGNGGVVFLPNAITASAALALDNDGNIVLGAMQLPNGGGAVVRLLPNGVADPAFGGNGVAKLESGLVAKELVIDSGGGILVAGPSANGSSLVRIDPGGAVDAAFNGGSPVRTASMPVQLAVDAAGAIFVWSERHIERFTATGARDAIFSGGGAGSLPTPTAAAGLVEPDGGIVTVGAQATSNDGDLRSIVTRRSADGSPDTAFGFFGTTTTELAGKTDVAVQLESAPDGKTMMLVASGRMQSLLRINADGTLDETFGSKGRVLGFFWPAFMVDDVGRTVVLLPSASNIAMRRYDERGNVDPSFGTAGDATFPFLYLGEATGLARADDGKIVVTGILNGAFFVFRANADGTRDTSFGTNGITYVALGDRNRDPYRDNSVVYGRATPLPGGGLAIVATVKGRAELIRLDANGALAPFGTNGVARGESAVLGALAAFGQPSGAVVALGLAGDKGDTWVVERFDASGRVDATFGDGGRIAHPNASVAPPELSVDATGKVYVTSVVEGGRDVVSSRYTVDGALDESWGPGGRRTIVGDSFGIERVSVMRASADGSLRIAGRRFTQSGAVDVVMARLAL